MAGNVLLITGASSDIGLALIRSLVAPKDGTAPFDGAIIAHARTGAQRLEALVGEMPSLAGRIEILAADLAAETELAALIDTVKVRHGHPTHIVHLAATRLKLSRVTSFSWPALCVDLAVQLRSLAALISAFAPAMLRSGVRCKIVVMLSSVTLAAPPKFMPEYTVAKYALLGYFRALCAELADKPICINAVSPSMVDTQFLSDLPPLYVAQAGAAHPSKRNATPDDVTPAIRFLLSAESDYISGANLPVTGGSAS